MSTLGRMWRGLWRRFRQVEGPPQEAESGELEAGEKWFRPALRLAIVFALLFGGGFFALWWAGSRYASARHGRGSPVSPGESRARCVTPLPTSQIPWARVEDDPGANRHFFAPMPDYGGVFELLTLPSPHPVAVSAPGYHVCR
jgi:hypothetical protein